MVGQLIIIGNGFDIHCGLKSKFSDYFDKNKPKNNSDKMFFNRAASSLPSIKNSYFFKQQSFWDIYFRLLSTIEIKDWADVEKQIIIFLTHGAKSYDLLDLMSLKFLGRIIKPYESEYDFSRIKQSIGGEMDSIKRKNTSAAWASISDVAEKLSICMDSKTKNNNDGLMSIQKAIYNYMIDTGDAISNDLCQKSLINTYKAFLYDFLFKELQAFESNLKGYLNNLFKTENVVKVENNGSISSVSKSPEGKITKYMKSFQDCLRKISKNSYYNLLSFNYTYPIEIYGVYSGGMGIETVPNVRRINLDKCNCYTNIHGSLDKDIIIGIDEKGIDENDILYRFTKTYRLFELDNKESCLDKNIKHIKFYGHSLAAADYSYFQSIFDFYDIYNSDVDLTFYYSDYDGNQRHVNVDRVVKLIKAYGNTLDNKDHGKNLLHKMKLENRLLIKEL